MLFACVMRPPFKLVKKQRYLLRQKIAVILAGQRKARSRRCRASRGAIEHHNHRNARIRKPTMGKTLDEVNESAVTANLPSGAPRNKCLSDR